MRQINIFLAVLLIMFFVTSGVSAQEQPMEAASDGGDAAVAGQRYEGSNYTIEAPRSWTLVSGNLGEKELAKLPDMIRERYTRRNSDVIFMDLSSDNRAASGFQNSLNIVTINEPLEFNDDVIKELSAVLKQQFTTMFESFEIQSIGMVKLNNKDVLKVKGSYELLDYKVIIEQALIPLKAESIVVTCTYDEQTSETVSELCKKSFESIRQK